MKHRTQAAHDDGQRRLAILIDADNAQASVIEGLLTLLPACNARSGCGRARQA